MVRFKLINIKPSHVEIAFKNQQRVVHAAVLNVEQLECHCVVP